MSEDLTAESVEAALARPLEQRDGVWRCQVCDRGFETKQAVGPHQLQHRRAVGLAPPKAASALLPAMVHCGLNGCHSSVRRAGYRAHLRNVHRMNPTAVERTLQERSEQTRKVGPPPAVIEEAPEPAPEPIMTGLTGLDAAAGILSAALRDGLVPVEMLGSVVQWIGQTDTLLAELGRQRNRTRR